MPGIEDARFGPKMRFEPLHTVVAKNAWIGSFSTGFFRSPKMRASLGQTLHTGRFKPAGDPVIAEGALLGGMGDRVEEPAAVRAGLDAKAAADAILGIDQHRAVGGLKGRADRADLGTRRVLALVAELGHEERVQDLLFGNEASAESRRCRRWGYPQ